MFEGTLKVKGKVVIGSTAIVKGDIICDNCDICGKLDGNVYVKDTLGLKDGCVVNGNLHIRRISVELGSTFNGNCRMMNEGEFDKLSGVDKKPAVAAAPGVHAAPAQPHAAPAN
jgi:cytoskeletal protein CcmA (bactofilin family)